MPEDQLSPTERLIDDSHPALVAVRKMETTQRAWKDRVAGDRYLMKVPTHILGRIFLWWLKKYLNRKGWILRYHYRGPRHGNWYNTARKDAKYIALYFDRRMK